MAQQSGFAAARKPHDAKDLAAGHRQSGIRHADTAAKAAQRFGLGHPPVTDALDRLIGLAAKNLPDPFALDHRIVAGSCILLLHGSTP